MLLTCPECQGSVSDTANACPHCGTPIDTIIDATKEMLKAVKPDIRGRVCELCGERLAVSKFYAKLNRRKPSLLVVVGVFQYEYISVPIPLCAECYAKIHKKEHSLMGGFLSILDASGGTIALRNVPVIKALRKDGWSMMPPPGKKMR